MNQLIGRRIIVAEVPTIAIAQVGKDEVVVPPIFAASCASLTEFVQPPNSQNSRGQSFSKPAFLSYPSLMAIENILSQIDAEIARLQQARKVLANIGTTSTKVGRKAVKATVSAKPGKKRKISAEGRKRIAEAQRKRWAAQRAKAKTKKA